MDGAKQDQPAFHQLVVDRLADRLLPLLAFAQLVQRADAVPVRQKRGPPERGVKSQKLRTAFGDLAQEIALAGAQRTFAALELCLVQPPLVAVGDHEPAAIGQARVIPALSHGRAVGTILLVERFFPGLGFYGQVVSADAEEVLDRPCTAARPGVVDRVLGIVLAMLEAENFIEDRLNNLLARIGFAADPLSFQTILGGAKLGRVSSAAPASERWLATASTS